YQPLDKVISASRVELRVYMMMTSDKYNAKVNGNSQGHDALQGGKSLSKDYDNDMDIVIMSVIVSLGFVVSFFDNVMITL
ncbi:hypothetical protein WUBG_02666, partial [Wuchereria bancrofti]